MKNPILTLLGALVVLAMAANSAYAAPTTEKGPRCSDSIDNDGDGLIDADDPDCGGATSEPRLVVVDSTGQVVAPVVETDYPQTSIYADVSIDGSFGTAVLRMLFFPQGTGLDSPDGGKALYFESTDCTGSPYVGIAPYFTALASTAFHVAPNEVTGDQIVYVASGPQSLGFTPGSEIVGYFETGAPSCQVFNSPDLTTMYYPAQSIGDFRALFPPPYDVIEQ